MNTDDGVQIQETKCCNSYSNSHVLAYRFEKTRTLVRESGKNNEVEDTETSSNISAFFFFII